MQNRGVRETEHYHIKTDKQDYTQCHKDTSYFRKLTCKWSCEYGDVGVRGEVREDADDDACRRG